MHIMATVTGHPSPTQATHDFSFAYYTERNYNVLFNTKVVYLLK